MESTVSTRPTPLLRRSLNQRVNVYTDGTTGAFDVLLYRDVPCRLMWMLPNVPSAPYRAQRADVTRLIYDPTYHIPEGSQIEMEAVGGASVRRWNTVSGTDTFMVSLSGVPYYNSIDLVQGKE